MNKIIGVFVSFFITSLAYGALACEAVSADMHIKAATAAFTGTITKGTHAGSKTDEILEFTVDQSFRGNISGQTTVVVPAHPCRYKKYETGELWLILGALGENGKVKITWDTPSIKIRNADGTPTDNDISATLEKLKL